VSGTALTSSFIAGFGLMLGLIIAIGAQNAFVLRQGLRREHVAPVILFCAGADTLLVVIGVFGMAQVFDRAPMLAPLLTLGGAVFLFGYALVAWRRALKPKALHADRGNGARVPLAKVLLQTAAFTLLNPHVYIDTVLLVGSVGARQPGIAQGAFVVGTALASVGWFATIGIGARLLAPVFAKPAAWRWLDAMVGSLMFVLAVVLAWQVAAGSMRFF